jgi:hypothetical protein
MQVSTAHAMWSAHDHDAAIICRLTALLADASDDHRLQTPLLNARNPGQLHRLPTGWAGCERCRAERSLVAASLHHLQVGWDRAVSTERRTRCILLLIITGPRVHLETTIHWGG